MTQSLYVIQRSSTNQFHSAMTPYNWNSNALDDSVVMTADQLLSMLLRYEGCIPDKARIRLVRLTPPAPPVAKYEIIQ